MINEPRLKVLQAYNIYIQIFLLFCISRGAFIDQSQSLNSFISDPNYEKMTSMHFYGWKLGLKTGKLLFRVK